MRNIFLLPVTLTEKERFTGSWEYLLDNIPELGQQLVDQIMAIVDKPPVHFEGICAYAGSPDDKILPDLVLECRECDIFCENKLESNLDRHHIIELVELAATRPRPTYCLLITNSLCQIEPEVLDRAAQSDHYLSPSDPPYFCWQDFYGIIANRPERLAQEFAEYMETLDMRPWEQPLWGNLFLNSKTAARFGLQWVHTKEYFESMGAKCRQSGNSSLEVSYPVSWLQLFYLYTCRSVQNTPLKISGPYLVASLWVKGDQHEVIRAFRGLYAELTNHEQGYSVEVHTSVSGALWTSKDEARPKLVATYYTELNQIVDDSPEQMQQNLLNFAKMVYVHGQCIAG